MERRSFITAILAGIAAIPFLGRIVPAKPNDDFAQSMDAREWARSFIDYVKRNPSLATDEGVMIAWFANSIMRGYDEGTRREIERQLERSTFELSGSEAVYGFAAWLTTRREPITMSAAHDSSDPAVLVDRFCMANELQTPRSGWNRKLRHPKSR